MTSGGVVATSKNRLRGSPDSRITKKAKVTIMNNVISARKSLVRMN